ncbi:hypothetical protein THIARS_50095 [Thiomonas delicata]|uniref:Uncharacterized protein n=1 Tax=Thiomonas delicata TaxID=364030 RepID=A0A238D0Q8_THIDL|nr:hypothetical protein THIARS_50095 [Thiomonas delicata]
MSPQITVECPRSFRTRGPQRAFKRPPAPRGTCVRLGKDGRRISVQRRAGRAAADAPVLRSMTPDAARQAPNTVVPAHVDRVRLVRIIRHFSSVCVRRILRKMHDKSNKLFRSGLPNSMMDYPPPNPAAQRHIHQTVSSEPCMAPA